MIAFVKDATLPSKIQVGSRLYDVLGFYNVQGPTKDGVSKWKADKAKVVLQESGKEAIVTDWPMKVYKPLTEYKEWK